MENTDDIYQNGGNGKYSKDKENRDKSKDYYKDEFKGKQNNHIISIILLFRQRRGWSARKTEYNDEQIHHSQKGQRPVAEGK